MKCAVAWMSIEDGVTGMSTQFARHSSSCSSTPETPPGASMMSCFVSAGTYMPKLRSWPNFSRRGVRTVDLAERRVALLQPVQARPLRVVVHDGRGDVRRGEIARQVDRHGSFAGAALAIDHERGIHATTPFCSLGPRRGHHAPALTQNQIGTTGRAAVLSGCGVNRVRACKDWATRRRSARRAGNLVAILPLRRNEYLRQSLPRRSRARTPHPRRTLHGVRFCSSARVPGGVPFQVNQPRAGVVN